MSDTICKAHGLEVLQPGRKKESRGMNTREYRAALRGESWKFKLINAIDIAMEKSRTKEEFISGMEKLGYGVKWEPHYKYITYTTPQGQKCRDNRLHEEKYLKQNMEEYYHAGLSKTEDLNKQTDNLQKPYELQVMAIPKELWDAMVQYQTEIGKYLLQASDHIVKLPTWENITEELSPALGTMTTRIKEGTDRTTARIATELQTQMKELRRELSSQMMKITEEAEKKLQMRDLSPVKLKLKWAGLGASASMMLFTLLRLLKIL